MEIKDIERLAELARLKLTSEEVESMRNDVNSILGYINQIQEVVTENQIPQAGIIRNVLREDGTPHESGLFSEALLNEAPNREGEYFKVKKILGGGDVA